MCVYNCNTRKNGAEEMFEVIIAEMLPKLFPDTKPQIAEVRNTKQDKYKKQPHLDLLLICLTYRKTKDKRKFWKKLMKEENLPDIGNKATNTANVSLESTQAKVEYCTIFQVLTENNQHRIQCLAKVFCKSRREIDFLKQNHSKFVASRTVQLKN